MVCISLANVGSAATAAILSGMDQPLSPFEELKLLDVKQLLGRVFVYACVHGMLPIMCLLGDRRASVRKLMCTMHELLALLVLQFTP